MFIEFLNKSEFYEQYMENFSVRFTISNLELEKGDTIKTNASDAIQVHNNQKAFCELINKNPERLTAQDIIQVGDNINKNLGFFDKGFRKTQVMVNKATNFFPPKPNEIQTRIYYLLNSYYEIWKDLDIYEKEAKFHIEFVRMQPFEDGNKRTARVLTNFNLCSQNKAPIIINESENDEYFSCIDNYDVKKLGELFRKKSKEELETMIELYKSIVGNDSFEIEVKHL